MGPGVNVSFVVAFGAGGLSFLSPCVLPLVPSYLSYVTGMSLEELAEAKAGKRTRWPVLLHSLLFILGFSTVFVLMGASFGLLGRLLFAYRSVFTKVAGAFIVLMGLSIAGPAQLPFFMRGWRVQLRERPAGALGAYLIGMAFAVGWTPCIGPILGAILAYASVAQTASAGTALLGAYSLGLGLPFLLSALAVDSFFHRLARLRAWLRPIQVVGGAILVIVGILVFTGSFTLLNSYAISLTPKWLLERL